jgi:hypothetical protein
MNSANIRKLHRRRPFCMRWSPLSSNQQKQQQQFDQINQSFLEYCHSFEKRKQMMDECEDIICV